MQKVHINNPIYFDHASSTPVHPDIIKGLTELTTAHYANSESLHQAGLDIQTMMRKSREAIALMLKVKSEKTRLVALNNGKTNNWSIAWKPPIQIKDTVVTDIEWNVSRLGRVIPTVIYEPIELCGTVNTRVTGNNAKWILEREIQIGSKISVGKAGEIIPKIISVSNQGLCTGFKNTGENFNSKT